MPRPSPQSRQEDLSPLVRQKDADAATDTERNENKEIRKEIGQEKHEAAPIAQLGEAENRDKHQSN